MNLLDQVPCRLFYDYLGLRNAKQVIKKSISRDHWKAKVCTGPFLLETLPNSRNNKIPGRIFVVNMYCFPKCIS